MAVKKTKVAPKRGEAAAPKKAASAKGAAKKETAPAKAVEAKKAPAAKAAKPKAAPAASPKAPSPKKAEAKKAPAAPKLSAAQAELLKAIGGAGDAGYLSTKKAEARTIEALRERKLVKKGAKDKASGNFHYVISSTGKKHLGSASAAAPVSAPASPPAGN